MAEPPRRCIPSHHPQSHVAAWCTVCLEPVPWAAGEHPNMLPKCKGKPVLRREDRDGYCPNCTCALCARDRNRRA